MSRHKQNIAFFQDSHGNKAIEKREEQWGGDEGEDWLAVIYIFSARRH